MATIDFKVSFKGQTHSLSLPPETPFEELQARLEELTSVPPRNQKLLYKGKKASINVVDTIVEAGIKSGSKVQLLGSTSQELGDLRQVENEFQRRERILQARASGPQAKLRNTGSSSSSAIQYRFHNVEPLAHLPNPSSARQLLQKLTDDPAIKHIMRTHQFSVGLLTELAPHEHPQLLGLNVNAGQAIKLRLRTDAYDGFRLYKDVRRVLCHELTHNVWGDHDNNFKELNSKLNKEVLEFEREAVHGAHTLADLPTSTYQPSSEQEAFARSYVLGGQAVEGNTADDRRQLMLQAVMKRLKKEEEELENSCGTLGPSATNSSNS